MAELKSQQEAITADTPLGTLYPALVALSKSEYAQIPKSKRRMVLQDGRRIGSFLSYFYYQFEMPEERALQGIERVAARFGSANPELFEARIVETDAQFVTLAVPYDTGPVFPELECTWSHDPLASFLESATEHVTAQNSLASSLQSPGRSAGMLTAGAEPILPPETVPTQADALRAVLRNPVTLVWGPARCGKTNVAAMVMLNIALAGKNVLAVSADARRGAALLKRTVALAEKTEHDTRGLVTMAGFPPADVPPQLLPYLLESELDMRREERRKLYRERITLLSKVRSLKVKQILHEEYFSRIQNLRDKKTELKQALDDAERKLKEARAATAKLRDASLIERLKKGMGKEDLSAAEGQTKQAESEHAELNAQYQSLSNDILSLESRAPVSFEEFKEFRELSKRIDELGGLAQVENDVREFIAVNESEILASKRIIIVSAQTFFANPSIASGDFDSIIIEDSERYAPAFLYALAARASQRVLLTGDPYHMGLSSVTQSENARLWLQRDIVSVLAGTDEVQKYPQWAAANSGWCIFLAQHFAPAPKLALFANAVLFDDRLNVFTPKEAKGKIYFIDTSAIHSVARQFFGRKKILLSNETHVQLTADYVKHAVMQNERAPADCAVVLPFAGSTLQTKRILRGEGLGGTPVYSLEELRGLRKKAVIFDTTVAGIDYSIRQFDDKKIGEHRIARLFHSLFAAVDEDLYIIADMNHFRTVYKDRLTTKLLMLLQAESHQLPQADDIRKSFENFDKDKLKTGARQTEASAASATPTKEDAELALRMKMMAKKQAPEPQAGTVQYEREAWSAGMRLRAHWTDVNITSQCLGNEIIFSSSITAERAWERSVSAFCQSEKDFRGLVEALHALIIRSGVQDKRNLPYLSTDVPETRIRADVTSFSRLLAPSGDQLRGEDKQKAGAALSKFFQEAVGKAIPASNREWHSAAMLLARKCEQYLAWISEQLRK